MRTREEWGALVLIAGVVLANFALIGFAIWVIVKLMQHFGVI